MFDFDISKLKEVDKNKEEFLFCPVFLVDNGESKILYMSTYLIEDTYELVYTMFYEDGKHSSDTFSADSKLDDYFWRDECHIYYVDHYSLLFDKISFS